MSIEAEENANNQEIRFRGFLSRSQLYEFMPRYFPLTIINVGRADVIWSQQFDLWSSRSWR